MTSPLPFTRRALTPILAMGLALALLVAPAAAGERWIGAWAASQQVPEPRNALPDEVLTDATVRQIVQVTAGGPRLRVRISNLFGTEPLVFSAVRVAKPVRPGSSAIDPATDRPVTFEGHARVVVPAGAEYVSDPVELAVAPLTSVTVTYHLPRPPKVQTGHPGARTTTFVARGQRVSDPELPPDAVKVVRWYQLSGVDVPAGPQSAAIVVFGDSITDGFGTGPDRNERWPDFLAQRLQADPAGRRLSVINHGIGGNRLLLDGLGPNGLARFERDVLGQRGVRYVVILIGVNDIGFFVPEDPASPNPRARLAPEMIGAYRQMVARARERGIKVIGATILPFGRTETYKPGPAHEADRQAVNAWIRQPGNFDAVIDFDAVMRDPARPDHLRPDLDSGDQLHPSIAGYRAMAAAVPLELFRP